ncbi:unnamed protein product [Rotaria sp. Silwood2]|nr:unnamed protein product [Rotaria sp. Silwood2]CAF2985633.1 unnamed protein product [Rotaria sp. Silwood2]CAF3909064.1 unnamed protein product [Rotaria sp. Silwood2]CAF4057513.1 unnamed protein product [Rotaria sp. Silwood2]
MHTEQNTDINIIIQNCKKRNLENNQNNCVLIITGSLNPIHCSHIKTLQLVRKYLESHKSRQLNVLAAYLSPTHDSYVRDKLGRSDWITAADRCKLCEDVIGSDENIKSWISVAKGECNSNEFVDFDEVTLNLADFLNSELYESEKLLKHPLKVVYVCGLDHFNKCPYVRQLATKENVACAVLYRPGASDSLIKSLETKSPNLYYIALDDERETLVNISSTVIRQHYNSAKIDLTQFTYPCVIQFLEDKYNGK